MANNLPINTIDKELPIGTLPSSSVAKRRAADEAKSINLLFGEDEESTRNRIENGDKVPVSEARIQVGKTVGETSFDARVNKAFESGQDPDEFVQESIEEEQKRKEWYSTGERFYLEQALGLNDPAITAEGVRFATNLQIGQELFEAELEKAKGDIGNWTGYAGDFLDRYVVRALGVGGLEQMTGRNTRKGQELLGAAASMPPADYEAFIKNYIQELKAEGVFLDENIFALMDGAAEFANKGYDSHDAINRIFGFVDVLPVAGAISKVGLKAGKMLKSTTTLQRVSAMKGPEVGGEAAKKIFGGDSRIVKPRESADMAPSIVTPGGSAPVHVPVKTTVEIVENNKIIQGIEWLNSRNFLGQGKTSVGVKAAYDAAIDLFRKASNNPIVNVRHPLQFDTTGTPSINVLVGKVKTGAPFKTKRAAQGLANKLKEEFPTARTTLADESDPSKGYYVQFDEQLNTGKYAPEIQNKPAYVVRQVLARIFGSKRATEDLELHGAALRAESGASALANLAKKQARALDKLPSQSKRILSKIYGDLRDGIDSSYRTGYTDEEFIKKWKEYHPKSHGPSKKELEAFYALQEVNDAAWLMRAHTRLQKYIANDYYAVQLDGGTRVAARRVTPPTQELIWNPVRQANIMSSDLRKNQAVWELDQPLEGGVRFITEPEGVSILQHGDVLGYNAGGLRVNPNANQFITFGTDRPRAVIAAFSEAEATTAVTELRTIQNAIREAGGVKAVTKSKQLDDIVANNNTWNPEIETMEELLQWADLKRVNLDDEINMKARDGRIQTGETKDNFSTTWDEYVKHNMYRSDDVLTEFGGKEAMQRDPVASIFGDYASVTHQYANNIYTNDALNAWVKAAKREGSGWEWRGAIPSDPRHAFEEAVQSRGIQGNSTALGLNTQRSLIQNRLAMKTGLQKDMENYGASIRNFVFDKTGLKIGRNPAERAQSAMLTLGFQSAFGLTNISQFFVQSYHVAVIVSISPKHGLQGASLAIPMRMALMAPDSASATLAARRLAKHMGVTEGEVSEILEYIRTSGRDILDGSMAELGTGKSWGLSGWKGESFLPSHIQDITDSARTAGSKALQVGLTPFKEGEMLSRVTAINTAILEYKAANPGISILSDEARRWISKREAALSFNMSNADRAMIQSGVGKLPTQWFTYSLRALENIVIGREFTGKERIRMSLALMPAFGTTGMGIGFANDYITSRLDYIGEKTGLVDTGSRVSDSLHTAVKRGVWDAFFEFTTGEEIDLASRLAPITLFQDVYRNAEGAKSPFAMAAGPSGDITAKMLGSVMNVADEIINGNSVSVTNDTIRVLRNFSGIDNIAKANGILQNGLYRSRTGVQLPFELDTGDAIMQLMGFSPRELSEWYQESRLSYNHKKDLESLSKEMQSDWITAMEVYQKDPESGLSLMKVINDKITLAGLSVSDQKKVRSSLKVTLSESLYRMIHSAYLRGDTYHAEQLEKSFNYIGTGE